jgi:hypothetical protein
MERIMKKLLFSFVIFSVLLIIGCQENSITDPLQVSGDVTKAADSPLEGTIQMQGMLSSPYHLVDTYILISGEVDYQLTTHYLDKTLPYNQTVTTLKLSVKAELTNYYGVRVPPVNQAFAGTISEETIDAINLDTDALHTVIKSYKVQKRDDEMVLNCRFAVNSTGVKLEAMWLELGDGSSDSVGSEL